MAKVDIPEKVFRKWATSDSDSEESDIAASEEDVEVEEDDHRSKG